MNEFPERLRHALHTRHMSQSELARNIGVKPQAIQYLCRKGKGKRSVHTSKIAEALSINTKWLTDGEGAMEITEITKEVKRTWNIGTEPQGNVLENSNHYKTPFFQAIESLSLYFCEWDQLSHFLSTNENKMEFKKMIVEKIECSEKAFIVVISHNLFHPYATQGEFCLIDPDTETLNKKVLVKINETFLIMEHIKLDQDYFRSLNGELPLQKISEDLNYQIIGVVKGIWKPMRKG